MNSFRRNRHYRIGRAQSFKCVALVAALWTVQCHGDASDGATAEPRGRRDAGKTTADGGKTQPSSVASKPSDSDAEGPASVPESEPEPNADGGEAGGVGQLADAGNVEPSNLRDASAPGEAPTPDDAAVVDAGDYPSPAGGAGGVLSGGAAGSAEGGVGGSGGIVDDVGAAGSRADGGSEPVAEPSFEEVHAVLSVWCAPCHDQNYQEDGRKHGQADIDAAYANIQLLGAAPIGAAVSRRRMPPAGAPNGPLEQSQIDLIVAWVNAGAPR